MFDGNIRTLQRIAAKMQRVLIVDPHPAAGRLLADHLRHVGGHIQIFNAPTIEAGWGMARTIDPMLFFVEHASSGCDGLALARKIRRSDLACRENPIIMCTAEATAEAIFGARDAGIHEFMRKPFTIKDLERRLEAVTLKPRDWVEAVQYVGPDRRRFNSAEYNGPRKRKADAGGAPAARLSQALRIVKSAAQALDSDPAQARRALAAQAVELKKVGETLKDARLVEAAAALGACMTGGTARVELVKRIDVVMGFLIDDGKSGRATLEVA
ncbi:response regulator transcription factor [Caulobacter sp. Root487D2Y]|uniref:response regulator transcription factor n=1 Tax=Caulobacter sp. Root487D2Y TaxID=1736547 RepID=UPI000A84C54C|nr:response regulator [Caulobacter sp. Root487D2Y]